MVARAKGLHMSEDEISRFQRQFDFTKKIGGKVFEKQASQTHNSRGNSKVFHSGQNEPIDIDDDKQATITSEPEHEHRQKHVFTHIVKQPDPIDPRVMDR